MAWSELPGLEGLIERITSLPDDVWDERVRSHLSQARLYGGYFLRQAVERGDPFLRRHAGVHLALAAARAVLAAAHVMLPGPKYVSRLVRTVPTPLTDETERPSVTAGGPDNRELRKTGEMRRYTVTIQADATDDQHRNHMGTDYVKCQS